ncbi:lytic transglycosylase domain-containing protein [uncultured Thiohalocapsa sp.]|uniref:lytic transglycosylase domain-containing protein n=1 Tax=uncultured Thiohalocapsa sp. TaxID=768990 RepID=UPI0025F1C402|nr:lytic transglycosylase domain-containing protein [uncultured Thiohalocapsa sp.]
MLRRRPLHRRRGLSLSAVLWLAAWLTPGLAAAPAAADAPGSAEATRASDTAAAQQLPQPPGTPRPSRAAVNKLVDRYARRAGLERELVHAVVRAESGYDAHAVSHAGAVGLMQIMPATAADYGVRSVAALFDAETNVRIGTRHLKRLVSRYGIGKAVMAYNAGEGALQRHGGFVTYAETQRYTHRVLTTYLQRKGVSAYSAKARQITGISLTPAMASAGASAGGRRGLTPREQARRMRGVDLSTLSLKVRPSLTDRALDPSVHDTGPESRPMFVLERPDAKAAD